MRPLPKFTNNFFLYIFDVGTNGVFLSGKLCGYDLSLFEHCDTTSVQMLPFHGFIF